MVESGCVIESGCGIERRYGIESGCGREWMCYRVSVIKRVHGRIQEHIEQAKPVREHISNVNSEIQTWRPDVIFSNHQICTCTDSR